MKTLSQPQNLITIIRDQCLADLFTKWSYLSLDQVLTWLSKQGYSADPKTVTKYLASFSKDELVFDAGRGWYSKLASAYRLDREPVKEIVKVLQSEFPNLTASCWSTEQINRHLDHLLSSFVTFVHVERGFEQEVDEILNARGWRVFFGKVGTHPTSLPSGSRNCLLRTLVSRSPTQEGFATIEKIIVDARLEKILPATEVDRAVASIVDFHRINLGTFLSYAKRRRLPPEKALKGARSINSTIFEKVELKEFKTTPRKKNRMNKEIGQFLSRAHLRAALGSLQNVNRQTLERSVRALALVSFLVKNEGQSLNSE